MLSRYDTGGTESIEEAEFLDFVTASLEQRSRREDRSKVREEMEPRITDKTRRVSGVRSR